MSEETEALSLSLEEVLHRTHAGQPGPNVMDYLYRGILQDIIIITSNVGEKAKHRGNNNTNKVYSCISNLAGRSLPMPDIELI